jgi:hypothetical protein
VLAAADMDGWMIDPPAEADRWTAELVEDGFFAALTYCRCTGTVPA